MGKFYLKSLGDGILGIWILCQFENILACDGRTLKPTTVMGNCKADSVHMLTQDKLTAALWVLPGQNQEQKILDRILKSVTYQTQAGLLLLLCLHPITTSCSLMQSIKGALISPRIRLWFSAMEIIYIFRNAQSCTVNAVSSSLPRLDLGRGCSRP